MHSIQFPKNRISRIVNEIFCVTVIPLCLFPFAVSRGAEYQLPDNGNTIFAQPGAGEGNTVLINDSVTGGGWAIIGGYTSGADAGWNKIITDNVAKDIQIGMSILGGLKQAGTGAANSNEIRLANSGGTTTVSGDIRGGFNQGTGNADNNEIHLENTVVAGAVQGGIASRAGDTLENKVSMTGGSVAGIVAGGYIDGTGSGRADGNRVSLAGTSVVQGITGGLNYGSGKSSASSNTVFINHVDGNTGSLNGAAEGPAFRTGKSPDVSPDETGAYVVGGHISYMGEGDTNDNHVIILWAAKMKGVTVPM